MIAEACREGSGLFHLEHRSRRRAQRRRQTLDLGPAASEGDCDLAARQRCGLGRSSMRAPQVSVCAGLHGEQLPAFAALQGGKPTQIDSSLQSRVAQPAKPDAGVRRMRWLAASGGGAIIVGGRPISDLGMPHAGAEANKLGARQGRTGACERAYGLCMASVETLEEPGGGRSIALAGE